MTRPADQVALGSHQSAPAAFPLGSGRNSNNAAINISSVLSERGDPVCDNFADQSRALVIPVTFGGIRGAITARFIDFRNLHAKGDSRVCQK